MEHQEIKASADRLLASTNLLSPLEALGRLNITGSYRYNLMVDSDIDIEVFCEDPKQAAQNFVKSELSKDRWNGIMYFDWKQWHRDYFPTGYYVGCKHDFESQRWKVDIWFLPDSSVSRGIDALMRDITEDQRLLVLEAKRLRLAESWPCDSTAIYRAVIESDAISVEEVKQICTH